MKKISIISLAIVLMFSFVPLLANATSPTNVPGYVAPSSNSSAPATINGCSSLSTNGFAAVTQCALGILNSIIPIIVALTVLYVIWGAFGLARSDGEEDRKKYRDIILYGIVGLFVMVSIYGLVNILSGTFGGLSGGKLPPVQINISQ